MNNQLIEQVYNFLAKDQDNLDETSLNAVFARSGYDRGPKTIIAKCNEYISAKRYEEQLHYIIKLSKNFGEKIIFMKGILVAQDLYGDINKRKTSDIDILVRKQDVLDVGHFLLKEGFCCDEQDWMKEIDKNHLVFKKVPVVIELHAKVFNPPYIFEEFTEFVWKRAMYQNILGIDILFMDPYDRLMHYVLHYYRHHMELEILALMGLRSYFRVQPILDIYSTIKKYNLNFDILYIRIKEIDAITEFYEVFQFVYNIFPAICPEEFVCCLKKNSVKAKEQNLNFWRNKIPLYETIQNFFSKDYLMQIAKFIEYDYMNINYLDGECQKLLAYSDSRLNIKCDGCAKKNIKIKIEFTCADNKELNEFIIVIHYHFRNKKSDIYLNKLVIKFVKCEDEYVCEFHNGVGGQIYELNYSLNYVNENWILQFEILKEYFENEIITYSMNFLCGNKWGVCVSGKAWDDFKTMRHLTLKDNIID